MARRALVVAVVLSLAGVSVAQKKEIDPRFQQFGIYAVAQARYVYVTSLYGDPFSAAVAAHTEFSPPDSPRACDSDHDTGCVSDGDRQAVLDVREVLRKWGRFNADQAPKPGEGALVLVIGKAKTGSVVVGQPHAKIRLDRDILQVYDADRMEAGPLLEYAGTNALNPPEMELIQYFRKDVEELDKMLADKAVEKAAKKAAKAAEKAAKKKP